MPAKIPKTKLSHPVQGIIQRHDYLPRKAEIFLMLDSNLTKQSRLWANPRHMRWRRGGVGGHTQELSQNTKKRDRAASPFFISVETFIRTIPDIFGPRAHLALSPGQVTA